MVVFFLLDFLLVFGLIIFMFIGYCSCYFSVGLFLGNLKRYILYSMSSGVGGFGWLEDLNCYIYL